MRKLLLFLFLPFLFSCTVSEEMISNKKLYIALKSTKALRAVG